MAINRYSFNCGLILIFLCPGFLRPFTTGFSVTTSSASPTMQAPFDASTTQFVRFQNLIPASPFAVTLDGVGNWIRFASTGANQMVLDQNVNLTCQNISLFGYAQSKVNFGSSATIVFGANTKLYLQDNYTIASGDTALTFAGNTTIDGMGGKILQVDGNNKLILNSGVTLTLRNLDFLTTVGSPFSMTSTSTVYLDNCRLRVTSAGMAFSTGHLVWNGYCYIDGQDETNFNLTTSFSYGSAGTMLINSWSTVEVAKGINFVYQPSVTGDTNLYQTKRHLKFNDSSSTLFLNGAGLVSSTTGLALDKGHVKIGDRVTLTSSTGSGQFCELGSSLKMEILAGAVLELAGPVTYITT